MIKENIFSNKKGFTMIEIMMATSILAIIFGGMTLFGIQVIKGNSRSQAIKNNIENVSYAMEFINKSIRTSNSIAFDESGDESDEIFIVDNFTEDRICYFFEDKQLKRKIGESDDISCDDISSEAVSVAGDNKVEITGKFKIKETDLTPESGKDKTRGFVRTTVELKYTADAIDNFEEDKMTIQSSVSLRDYGFELE